MCRVEQVGWTATEPSFASIPRSGSSLFAQAIESDLLPGYMWSFPLPDGRANVGFGVQRNGVRRVRDMKNEWEDLLQRPHIVEALGPGYELEDRHTAWPIPAGPASPSSPATPTSTNCAET